MSPRLAGSVQGVVVQATADSGPEPASTPRASVRSGKRTKIEGEGSS